MVPISGVMGAHFGGTFSRMIIEARANVLEVQAGDTYLFTE
jgi:hypothetical protein